MSAVLAQGLATAAAHNTATDTTDSLLLGGPVAVKVSAN